MRRYRRRGGSIDYWVEAIRAASDIGRETAHLMSDVWQRLRRDVEERIESIIPLGGPYWLDLHGHTPAGESYGFSVDWVFYGIDSSRTRPVRVGPRYVAFVSATSVRLSPEQREAETVYMRVLPKPVPEAGDLASYKLELEMEMFGLEADALARTLVDVQSLGDEEGVAVVLDGPIVDPPGLAYRAASVEGLREKAETLVGKRAYLVGALSRHALVAGFVKSLRGSIFLEEYLGHERARLYGPYVGDRILAFAIASVVAEKAREYGLCGLSPIVVVTRPVPLGEDRAPDVFLYNRELERVLASGYRVYTSLYVPAYCGGNRRLAARIEFVSLPSVADEVAVRVAAVLERVVVPGSFLPMPVLLAHRSCTIRRSEGAKLLREVMSKHVVETLGSGVPSLLELFSD